ncbi:hypothetical protein IVB34_18225 [Bradyrhizobium sp. 2]|uniref:hypothetical protein n=1 Tax=unclassified Bradyrhizobium TaxID=2631580 RepID=UPI001FF9D874|nr:hypothetical protein [Bradyrhizobium sp. 2]MCK1460266.1 hypothetical protein [Bradyrhizobium sp. 2]
MYEFREAEYAAFALWRDDEAGSEKRRITLFRRLQSRGGRWAMNEGQPYKQPHRECEQANNSNSLV